MFHPPSPSTHRYLKSRDTNPQTALSISYILRGGHALFCCVLQFPEFVRMMSRWVPNRQSTCENTKWLLCWKKRERKKRTVQTTDRCWTAELSMNKKTKTYQPCPETATLKHRGWRLQPGATLLITCCSCF